MMKIKKAFTHVVVILVLFVTVLSPLAGVKVVSAASSPDTEESIVIAVRQTLRDFLRSRNLTVSSEDARVAMVRNYFESRGKLLAARHAEDFVEAADRYRLVDWRIVPAIAMAESSGCENKFETNNCFGFGSMEFESISAGIWYVTKALSGYHEPTAHFYEGKDVYDILHTYNPLPTCLERPDLTPNRTCLQFNPDPSLSYPEHVMKHFMNEISA